MVKVIKRIFKICEKNEWERRENEDYFEGSTIDRKDGFIHFSRLKQIKGTLKKHFKSRDELYLLEVDIGSLQITWEKSRNNELFPHLYGHLPIKNVIKVHRIYLGKDYIHVLPKEVRDMLD